MNKLLVLILIGFSAQFSTAETVSCDIFFLESSQGEAVATVEKEELYVVIDSGGMSKNLFPEEASGTFNLQLIGSGIAMIYQSDFVLYNAGQMGEVEINIQEMPLPNGNTMTLSAICERLEQE